MNTDHTPTPRAAPRLRRTLGDRGPVQTVVERGYRPARATATDAAE